MDIAIKTDEPGSVAKPFQCTICLKSFLRESSLEEHILNKHVADKEFHCTQCFETNQLVKSFATQHLLNKHIKWAHGPARFKCHICFKTFTSSSNLSAHKRNHSQANLQLHKCDLCSQLSRSKYALQAHLFEAHKQRLEGVNYFKCEICYREFVSRAKLELHVIREHVVDKAFECHVCSKKFIDEATLEKHMKRHDKQIEFFCDVCSKGLILKKSLIKHLGVQHNHFFYCDKCWRSFKNKSGFNEHSSDSEQKLKCDICQEFMNSECNLKIHTDSHVKEIKAETKDNKTENQITPLKADTKITQKTGKEINSENFYCELCSKTFDREAYFKAHRVLMHLNAEWKCNFEGCSKTFKGYSYLRLHKMEHAETKEFVCNICAKSFYRPDLLNKHKQVHLKEKKYKCVICPKSFTTTASLRCHTAYNHEGLKPLKCPFVNCGSLWANNSKLNVHLISHQIEKPFKCETCQPFRAFKSPRQLKKHQREVHSIGKTITALKSREVLNNRKHSDTIAFMCSEDACSFETGDEKDVALHYNEIHHLPKVTIFRC